MSNILIVDDEKSILSAMKRSLSDTGHEIFVAQTTVEALMLLEKSDLDVVIADYQLTNSNGAELLQMLSHRWPHVARILLTGYNSFNIAKEAINRAGVFKFITKPWDDGELRLVIDAAIKRSRLIRRNLELIKEIDQQNQKIEKTTKELERELKLKDKKLVKSRDSVLSYQMQINAVNLLLTKIAAGKSFKELVSAILEGISSVVRTDATCIVSTTKNTDDYSIYSQTSSETYKLQDTPDFQVVLETMERNKYIPLILSSIYATAELRELIFKNTKIYSIMIYPINVKIGSDQTYLFILALGRLGRETFTKDEVDRIKEVSGSINVALERLITSNYIQTGLKQWEETFNAILDPLFIVSPDYRLVRVNNAVENITKQSMSFMLGRYCYEVFRSGTAVCQGCLVNTVLSKTSPCLKEGVPCFPNQNIFASAYPVFDDSGKLNSVIQYNSDRNAEFGLYKQLIQSEKLAAIGLLAANIAHEINNPLGGILAYSQLLSRDVKSDSPVKSDLAEIESACLRCKKIITNLLDFSRDTSKDERIRILVPRMIEETLPLLKACIKSIEIVMDFEKDNYVIGNLGQLQQVFFNLITNASHAMPKGGRIMIKSKKVKNSFVEISVSDTGTGIQPQVLPNIFEPFFTTKEKGRGTGLGLFVTHGIITEHGGTIGVDSVLGTGTTFTIKLPSGVQ
jgi:two-component system, NtrC family, sensor kinase